MPLPTRRASESSIKAPDPPQTTIKSPPLATPTPTQPTQILTLPIRASATIENTTTSDGKTWRKALDILRDWEGFRATYWGRRVEEEDCELVEVIVFRDKLEQHYAFLSSSQFDLLKSLLDPLGPTATATASPPRVRVLHAHLQDFTRNARTLHGAPVTGTAIYTTTSVHGWEKAWALWTTIVPNVKGCLGCTGGWIVGPQSETDTDGESGDGERQGGLREYVVYVGWESIEDHDAYHHTKDFARKRVVLSLHNSGWRGYGHVRFATSKL
ncbi:uncharacterized protein BDW70DRAFT_165976 [Aspergillus foveolatus]|uniref:uncharacterized protein n=1 Tax=Aspergillus foveolatus TaxID=210207 RepID=UPI003CCE0B02